MHANPQALDNATRKRCHVVPLCSEKRCSLQVAMPQQPAAVSSRAALPAFKERSAEGVVHWVMWITSTAMAMNCMAVATVTPQATPRIPRSLFMAYHAVPPIAMRKPSLMNVAATNESSALTTASPNLMSDRMATPRNRI